MTESFWETEIPCVSACSKIGDKRIVNFTVLVKEKIEFLMKTFPSYEWLAYLKGTEDEDGSYTVEDLILPKQIATSATVKPIDFPQDPKLIGVIHSHHNMSISFSGTDNEFINGNHKISILVSHTQTMGHVRVKTECGALMKVPVVIKVKYPTSVVESDFKSEIEEKINNKSFMPPPVVNSYDAIMEEYYGSYHRGGRHGGFTEDEWNEYLNKTPNSKYVAKFRENRRRRGLAVYDNKKKDQIVDLKEEAEIKTDDSDYIGKFIINTTIYKKDDIINTFKTLKNTIFKMIDDGEKVFSLKDYCTRKLSLGPDLEPPVIVAQFDAGNIDRHVFIWLHNKGYFAINLYSSVALDDVCLNYDKLTQESNDIDGFLSKLESELDVLTMVHLKA